MMTTDLPERLGYWADRAHMGTLGGIDITEAIDLESDLREALTEIEDGRCGLGLVGAFIDQGMRAIALELQLNRIQPQSMAA